MHVGSKGDCSDSQGVNALPLACVEVGKGIFRQVDGNHLKFGEFFGVIFEGKKDRVLGLLQDIEKEEQGVRKEEKKGPWEGRQGYSSKDN